jgi:hypothetical protein
MEICFHYIMPFATLMHLASTNKLDLETDREVLKNSSIVSGELASDLN